MASRIWLFGLVLGIPLIGFGVSEGIQSYLDTQLRSAVRARYPDADPNALATVTLDRLTREDPYKFGEFRGTWRNLNLMSAAAIGAGLVGIALLIGIRLAGLASRMSRTLLLYFFKPGLYLTAAVLVGLVLVHAAIAIGAIYYGESALIGRVHIKLIALVGLGALVGVALMAHSAFALVRTVQTRVIGKEIKRERAPALWDEVDKIARHIGALVPEHLIAGLDPNFFVTEAEVICLSGRFSGRTLYCSLPLARILSKDELSAIIGHELGHYKGLDTRFSQEFFPVYRGTASAIASLCTAGGEGAGAIALLPAIAILSYFIESFSLAERAISRSRELAADRESASVSTCTTMSSALVKVHAFAGMWEGMQDAAASALREGKAFVNASKTYAQIVSAHATPDALNGIADVQISHPTDSHPSLSVRLEALGTHVQDVSEAALNVCPTQAAIDLFPKAEAMEQDISGAYQAILAQQLGIQVGPKDEHGNTGRRNKRKDR